MTIYKCDRCGAEKKEKSDIKRLAEIVSMTEFYIPNSDLCEDCRNELKEWLKGESK